MNGKHQIEQENFVETNGPKNGVKNIKRKMIKKFFILLSVLLVFFLSIFTRNLTNFPYLSGNNFTNLTLDN